MVTVLKSDNRGFAEHGWLKSHHTFSFADYYNPKMMGFASLRVINEDHIDGGKGFGAHPHRDMEIVTYVVSGALKHQDSMGNSAVIKPGEVQHMSAGTGVVHSEFNNDPKQKVHLLQIWILPDRAGGNPAYGQKSFEKELNEEDLVLVVSKEGRDGSISIQQDADIYGSRLKAGRRLKFALKSGRGAWVQLVKGGLKVNGEDLAPGDAVAATQESLLEISATADSEFLLFDLQSEET